VSEVKPGKGKYKVTGYVAVVRVLDGSERYLYKGAVFDASQADAVSVKHLLEVDLISKVAERAPAVDAAARAAAEAKAKAEAEADAAAAAAKAEAEAAAKVEAEAAAEAAAAEKAKADEAAAAKATAAKAAK